VTMTSQRKFPLSLSGLSIAFALGLALWEWYFFFVVGTPPLENVAARLGFFTPNRLGFNLVLRPRNNSRVCYSRFGRM
jgi:hypothetical protein